MRLSINQSKWYDRIWVSFALFTKLPLTRIHKPSRDCYETAMEHFPLVGWFTGGVMAFVLYYGDVVLPWFAAIILSMASGVLITWGMREKELMIFINRFVGAKSQANAYGIAALVLYELLFFIALYHMRQPYAAFVVFAIDPFCRMIAGQITQMTPCVGGQYYRKFSVRVGVSFFIQGVLPLAILLYLYQDIAWQLIVFAPCVVLYFLYLIILHKLKGYTKDCIGAIFLLTELTVYLVVALWKMSL